MARLTADLEVFPPPPSPGPLFAFGHDHQYNCCPALGVSSFDTFADAYRKAADVLVERVGGEFLGHHIVFPIAQLYRHYVELRLKEIIVSARSVRNEPGGFPRRHQLRDLWKLTLPYMNGLSAELTDAHVQSVSALVEQLDDMDPSGTSFRYPVEAGQAPAFADVSHVNLKRLRDAVAGIAAVLDGASLLLSVELDLISEMRSCAS